MSILGPPTADKEAVREKVRARGASALFLDEMFDPLWEAGLTMGIDPVGLVAMSGIETGWGTFTRLVKPEYKNPCGLKVYDLRPYEAAFGTNEHSFAHMQFGSWRAGCLAMAQHLGHGYCKLPIYRDEVILTPRLRWTEAKPKCTLWRELDPWAGRAGYGADIERVARELL